MTLNQLEYFHRAATLQHFNLAAESLHISQPSLSRSMNALEQELGITLFEKKGRNIVLTKAGQTFLIYVEKILDDISDAKSKMKEIATNGGHIDIGYVAPLAHAFLPTEIHKFIEESESKNVDIHFYKDYTAHLIEGLKNNLYDVVFCAEQGNEPTIRFVPIMKHEMVVIMPKNHPLVEKEYIDHTCFLKYPIIGYDASSGLGKATSEFFEKHNIGSTLYDLPDESSIASFVQQDFGIALVADVDDIHRDDLVIKPLVEQEKFYHIVYMAYLKHIYRIPSVQKLITYFQTKSL